MGPLKPTCVLLLPTSPTMTLAEEEEEEEAKEKEKGDGEEDATDVGFVEKRTHNMRELRFKM